MTGDDLDLLYRLLPAFYRTRDAETGGQLRALMAVLGKPYLALQHDLDRLYDDLFIETCLPERIAGFARLLDLPGADGDWLSEQRALVAGAIGRRRGSRAPDAFEGLADLFRAATGWPALVVGKEGLAPGPKLPLPEDFAVSADANRGNGQVPPAVVACCVPVYEAQDCPVGELMPRFGPHWLSFNPLGLRQPLYTLPALDADAWPVETLPVPITHEMLRQDIADYMNAWGTFGEADRPDHSVYYGPGRSLAVFRDGALVKPWQITVTDPDQHPLEDHFAPETVLEILPDRGMLRCVDGTDPNRIRTWYGYAAPVALGGGWHQRPSVHRGSAESSVIIGAESRTGLSDAIANWRHTAPDQQTIIIGGSGRHYLSASTLNIPANKTLALIAAPGARPIVHLPNPFTIDGAGALRLEGLAVIGPITLANGSALKLTIEACTLYTPDPCNLDLPWPGGISIQATSGTAEVTLRQCLCGAIRLPPTSSLRAEETVVGAHRPDKTIAQTITKTGTNAPWSLCGPGETVGPKTTLEQVTLRGISYVAVMTASDTLAGAIFVPKAMPHGKCTTNTSYFLPLPLPGAPIPDTLETLNSLGAPSLAESDIFFPAWQGGRYPDVNYARLNETVLVRKSGGDGLLKGSSSGGELGAYARRDWAKRIALFELAWADHRRGGPKETVPVTVSSQAYSQPFRHTPAFLDEAKLDNAILD